MISTGTVAILYPGRPSVQRRGERLQGARRRLDRFGGRRDHAFRVMITGVRSSGSQGRSFLDRPELPGYPLARIRWSS